MTTESGEFRVRQVRETIKRPQSDLYRRKSVCASFRARLRALRLPIKTFARLCGIPVKTVYSWTLRTEDCTPPHPIALRILRLVEKRRATIDDLHQIAVEDDE